MLNSLCLWQYGVDPIFSYDNRTASQTISDKPAFTVTRTENADSFTVSGTYHWKITFEGGPGSVHEEGETQVYRSDITLTISNISFEGYSVYADIKGQLNADGGLNDTDDNPQSYDLAGKHVQGKYNFDADNDNVHIGFYVNSPSSPKTGSSLYFRIDGVLPKGSATSGRSSTAIPRMIRIISPTAVILHTQTAK